MTGRFLIRRIDVVALVVALSLAGMPRLAQADDTATAPSPAVGRFGVQPVGAISGVALDGQPLVGATVTVKRLFMLGDKHAQEVAATVTTDAEGHFAVTGLQAGEYLLELTNENKLVGTAKATLREGAMQATEMTLGRAKKPASAWGRLAGFAIFFGVSFLWALLSGGLGG